MTSFDTLQSISSRLNELTVQLSTSKLSKEELVEFEMLSRKLYERAVILNYKAKEERVYGKSTDKFINPILPFSNKQDELEKAEIDNIVAENNLEAIDEEHNIDITQDVEIETKDSDQIDDHYKEVETETSAEGERVQFDFSGGFETPSSEEKSIKKNEIHIIEELAISDEKEDAKQDGISNTEESSSESLNNRKEESIAQREETVVHEKSSDSLSDTFKEDNAKTASFYARFAKANKEAVGDRLGTSKINSLRGAIGLNDRLQFVSELFGGDTNSYNNAIDQLDQLGNSEDALHKLSEIASNKNWNKDDSSIDEFAHFITRRYVD